MRVVPVAALVLVTLVALLAGGVRFERFNGGGAALSAQGSSLLCSSLSADSAKNGCGRLLRTDAGGRNVVEGDTNIAGSANVTGRLHFSDATMNPSHNWANGSDSYYLQKVVAAPNASHLRLTMNDDDDESFQIWGGACRAGNCAGAGAVRHRFDALGNAWHAGAVSTARLASTEGARHVQLNGLTLAHTPHHGWWANGAAPGDVVMRTEGNNRVFLQNGHWNGLTVKENRVGVNTPDPEARLHVVGDARVDGAVRAQQLCIGATCVTEAALKKIK